MGRGARGARGARGGGRLPTGVQAAVLELRSAFWFVPTLILLLCTALAAGALGLDTALGTSARTGLFYEGDADGARELLGTIAGSMVAVGTTVFSITLVALQLASSQFGPRVLTNFVSDRGNQLAMGTFVGVFWYCLLVLRQVGDGDRLPYVAVTTSMVLAAVAVGVLVWFISHIVRTIQVMNLVEVIAADLEARVGDLFPEVGRVEGVQPAPDEAAPRLEGRGQGVRAEDNGYLRLVDLAALVALAREHDLVLRLEVRPGDFVVVSTPVMHAWRRDGSQVVLDDEVCHALARCLWSGPRRSREQDVEFPARQLVEVAVRALSPAVNDPVTAAACVHHLGAALCVAARRAMPPAVLADADGVARLVVGEPVTFERLVGVWFDQVRQNAAHHAYVHLQLVEALARVVACSEGESRLGPLEREARLVLEAAEQALPQQADRDGVRAAYDALEDDLARARGERV